MENETGEGIQNEERWEMHINYWLENLKVSPLFYPKDGGSRFLRKLDIILPNQMASHPRITISVVPPPVTNLKSRTAHKLQSSL
jgi:hypothetical protein